MKFKNNIFVIISIMIISILLLAACGDGGAQEKAKGDESQIQLKLGTNLPSEHLISKGYQEFADNVKEASDGRLDIQIYYSDQLGNERDVTESISNGTGDMAVIGTGEMARRHDPILIFDAPYVFENSDHLLAFANGDEGQEIWDEFAEKTNIRNLGTFYYGARQVTTADVAAKTPEDFKGLKLRVPDQPMPLAYGKALGANPTPMELGELYLALQQKVVGGQENPLPTILGNGFDEVQNNIIMTNHVISATSFIISDETYESLPDDLKSILDEEVNKAVEDITADVLASEKDDLKKLEDEGLNIIEPDIKAFEKNSEFIYDEFESKWGEDLYETIQSVDY